MPPTKDKSKEYMSRFLPSLPDGNGGFVPPSGKYSIKDHFIQGSEPRYINDFKIEVRPGRAKSLRRLESQSRTKYDATFRITTTKKDNTIFYTKDFKVKKDSFFYTKEGWDYINIAIEYAYPSNESWKFWNFTQGYPEENRLTVVDIGRDITIKDEKGFNAIAKSISIEQISPI